MRDTLPCDGAHKNEAGILNLSIFKKPGTHWTAYNASPGELLYFDSYGLPPPAEMTAYLRKRNQTAPLRYSTFKLQDAGGPPICGHLCLFVLAQLSAGQPFMQCLLHLWHLRQ